MNTMETSDSSTETRTTRRTGRGVEESPGAATAPTSGTDGDALAASPAALLDGNETAASSGRDEPAKLETSLPRRPRTANTLRQQVWSIASRVHELRSRHEVLASRWSFIAGWTRLIVALAASLSTISVLSNNDVAALVFSLTTAIISALNAAYNPADAAKSHRLAATKFAHAFRRLDDMLYEFDATDEGTIYISRTEHDGDDPYEAGYYAAAIKLTAGDLDRLSRQLAKIESEIEVTEESSPPINRLRDAPASMLQADVPQTYWGLVRYRRALRYAAKAREYRERARREQEAFWEARPEPWLAPAYQPRPPQPAPEGTARP